MVSIASLASDQGVKADQMKPPSVCLKDSQGWAMVEAFQAPK